MADKAEGKSDQTPSRININGYNQTFHAAPTHLEHFDVLLGRGRAYLRHPGNERMRTIVSDNLARYQSTEMRHDKTRITKEIVQTIKTSGDQPARFLRYDPRADRWTEVDDEVARVKVGTALRYLHKSSDAHAVSSTREMLRFPYEESSSEPARMIGVHQLYPDGDSSPLLSDAEILAELGYDIYSFGNEASGQNPKFEVRNHRRKR
jgi:hypothetical protein